MPRRIAASIRFANCARWCDTRRPAGDYKIVILDEAHQLTDDASNALLKTLEEPPDKVIFILATTQPEDLEDTIKSRAQLFQFRSLTFAEISAALERIVKAEKLEIEPGAIAVLARAAEGSLRDSLSLLEQAIAYSGDKITDAQVRELLGVVAESVLDELMAAIANQSTEQALTLVHRLISDGHNLQHFCREAIRHMRNLLVAQVCGADSELIAAPPDERPRLTEQAAQFSEEDLTRFFQILLSTDDDLRRKPDPRLHMELGILKLVTAQRMAPLEEVIAEMRGEATARPKAPAKSLQRRHHLRKTLRRRIYHPTCRWVAKRGAKVCGRGTTQWRRAAGPQRRPCARHPDIGSYRDFRRADCRACRWRRWRAEGLAKFRTSRRCTGHLTKCDARPCARVGAARSGEFARSGDIGTCRGAVRSDKVCAPGSEISVGDGGAREPLGTRRQRDAIVFSVGAALAGGDVAVARPDGTIAHSDEPGDRTAVARLC